MKRILLVFFTLTMVLNLSAQKLDQGTFYLSIGSAYTPMGELAGGEIVFPKSSSLFGFGSEWVTSIEIDGDDDDNQGNDYFDSGEKERLRNFNLSGQIGTFAARGLLLGIGVEYYRFSIFKKEEGDFDTDFYEDEEEYSSSTMSIAFSPFIKYYISLGESNAIFFRTSYTFGIIKSEKKIEYDYTYYYKEDEEEVYTPYQTSRIDFGTGIAIFVSESVALEPSFNFALSTYTQEKKDVEQTDQWGQIYYDDEEWKVKTNAFYIKLSVSLFL